MATKRHSRKQRKHGVEITSEAVKIFREMYFGPECSCDADGAKCAACERYDDLCGDKLHPALGLRPWEWPAVAHPEQENPYPVFMPAHAWFKKAQALYAELERRVNGEGHV